MAQPHIQTSFHAGEWAPALNARVDMAKYHSAAALLRNWFVDYRGGASTCVGTKYVLQAMSSGAWLIPFQASFTVSYMLEFGQNYIRFYNQGAPVLEAPLTISGASGATFTITANGYSVGDWIYVLAVGGITNVNGKYFIISAVTTNTVTVTDLFGNAVVFSGAYTSGGTAARVYTISSPYNASDLPLVKFAQNVQTLILCHPNYVPYVLTLISATNWTLTPVSFGATIQSPTGASVSSTIGSGSPLWHYAYAVTAIDSNGQESGLSTIQALAINSALASTAGANTLTWTAVPGAIFYNIYAASPTYNAAVPTGAALGFIGTCTGTTFIDSEPGIVPDFQTTPPIAQNPFQGAGVASATVTAPGTYTTVPTIVFDAAPAGGQTATGQVVLQIKTAVISFAGGGGYSVGDPVTFIDGIVLIVKTVSAGTITAFQPLNYPGTSLGSVTSGSTPSNPRSGSTHGAFSPCQVSFTWGVGQIQLIQGGAGYTSVPAITFSAGAATAIAVLAPASAGNPSVPIYFQQRLVLAGPPGSPQTFYMSQPGSYYNYNTSNPVEDDDVITASLVSSQLNTIKSLVSMQSGLIIMSDVAAWQINGGGAGAAITPANATAQTQSYVGASDLPLIVSNYDVLFVQSKGSIVRDMSYNFYANVWTGADISILSSHLFYGYSLLQWAWAEEPFKIVWAVRDDGILLSLTYLKEQELIGWAHRDTLGLFQSVGTITESTQTAGNVNAVYVIVQRTINGQVVEYVERMAERSFPYGMEDGWCVDAALQSSGQTPNATLSASQSGVGAGVTFIASASVFNSGMVGWVIRMGGGIATITSFTSGTQVTGTITQAIAQTLPNSPTNAPLPQTTGNWTLWTPFTIFGGLDHLNGQIVAGLADGIPVGPFTVVNGSITLANPATKVILGLSFTPQLQTLALDLGEPTIQGKRKKIPAVTTRCKDTLGLSIGSTFSNLVVMKDFVLGNVGSATNTRVTNLITADARTILDQNWTVPGQYCIQQSLPLPASVLGVIPEVTVGDTIK